MVSKEIFCKCFVIFWYLNTRSLNRHSGNLSKMHQIIVFNHFTSKMIWLPAQKMVWPANILLWRWKSTFSSWLSPDRILTDFHLTCCTSIVWKLLNCTIVHCFQMNTFLDMIDRCFSKVLISELIQFYLLIHVPLQNLFLYLYLFAFRNSCFFLGSF